MRYRTGVALGIGAGYVLGRTHKMRWALVLGAAAATGKLGSTPGKLVQRGVTALGASPELVKMADMVKGRLFDAGKAAAIAAATSRVDSLTDRLQGQTEALRRPRLRGGADDEEETAEKPRRGTRSRADRGADDEYDEPEDEARDDVDEEDEELDEEPADDEPARARSAPRNDRRRTNEGRMRRAAEPAAEDEEPVTRRRPRARSSTAAGDSPVRRTRR